MAVSKKVAIPATEKKATATVKVEPAKVEAPKAAVKEEVKEAAPKAAAKKAEPAKKAAAKKAPAKKAAAKKAELKTNMHVQFNGKSYEQEDLVKIAKDVWKYDLKQKSADLVSVELYVKPEESAVYYVMNKDFTGKFDI